MSIKLIIDTDEPFVNTLRDEIDHVGLRTDPGCTLLEGLSLAESKPFDAFPLNACMPAWRGVEILPRPAAPASPPEAVPPVDSGHPDEGEPAVKMGGCLERLGKTVLGHGRRSPLGAPAPNPQPCACRFGSLPGFEPSPIPQGAAVRLPGGTFVRIITHARGIGSSTGS